MPGPLIKVPARVSSLGAKVLALLASRCATEKFLRATGRLGSAWGSMAPTAFGMNVAVSIGMLIHFDVERKSWVR